MHSLTVMSSATSKSSFLVPPMTCTLMFTIASRCRTPAFTCKPGAAEQLISYNYLVTTVPVQAPMCQGWHMSRPFRCHFSNLQLIAHGQHGGSAYRRLHGPGQHGHRHVQEASVHMQTSTMPATMTHSHRCACRLSKQHTALPERARGPRRVLWQAARAQPYAGKSKAGAGPWRLPQSNRQRCAAAPALLSNEPSPHI